MKKLILVLTLLFAVTTAYSLPNFWYAAVAYNNAGQVITTGPLAQVDVTITDGTNTASQTFFGVPVDGFGVFNIFINSAGAVNMVAGTHITVIVNGVTVAGAPLTSIIYNGYHYGDFIDLDSEVAGILPDANVADDLTIDGGTINNTVIGGTTPADGTFENLYVPNGETLLDNGTSGKSITLRANANGAQSNAIVANSSSTIDNGYATLYASKDAGGDGAVAWFEDVNQSGGGSVLYATNTLNTPSTSNHVAEIQSTGFADAALLVGNAFSGGTAIEALGVVKINNAGSGLAMTVTDNGGGQKLGYGGTVNVVGNAASIDGEKNSVFYIESDNNNVDDVITITGTPTNGQIVYIVFHTTGNDKLSVGTYAQPKGAGGFVGFTVVYANSLWRVVSAAAY